MNKEKIIHEIERVEKAIAKTKSPYLKRDYSKHLMNLKKMLEKVSDGE